VLNRGEAIGNSGRRCGWLAIAVAFFGRGSLN
jgi:hypothetical protein